MMKDRRRKMLAAALAVVMAAGTAPLASAGASAAETADGTVSGTETVSTETASVTEYDTVGVLATTEVTSVTLPEAATVTVGEETALTATVLPEDATDQTLTWTSDSTDIAIVDENGTVTGVSAGTAVITATATNGIYGTCTVTVEEAAATTEFTDIRTDAYYTDAVLWAKEQGIAYGTTSTTFSPDDTATRAQMLTFLWRAKGSEAPSDTTSNPFTDVDSSAYYYDAVLWAVENNIVSGTTPTTFTPNAAVTRGQAMMFVWRSEGSPAPESTTCPFTDVSSTRYYYKSILWGAENSVTTGISETSFAPNAEVTRAQAVTFLYRAANLS